MSLLSAPAGAARTKHGGAGHMRVGAVRGPELHAARGRPAKHAHLRSQARRLAKRKTAHLARASPGTLQGWVTTGAARAAR